MAKLFLLRHFISQWNQENRFTGWVDVPLAKEGCEKAQEFSQRIFSQNISVVYTSPLMRNQQTVFKVLKHAGKYPIFVHLDGGKMEKWGSFKGDSHIPAYVSEKLNERYYGKLQGLDKNETMQKYGKDKVRLWRRSFEEKPPGGESLKGTFNRTVPFYKKYVEKDLKQGKNVLLVASHNSLRSIVKHIENISDKDIINFEIPYGGLLEYEFDGSGYCKK